MFEKPFKLEIVTPLKSVFQDEATSLSVPGTLGGFQVLYNHAPLLSSLEAGEMKVRTGDGNDLRFATSGGFVEVKKNSVIVLVEAAERADEINIERARAARERAQKRLHSQAPDIDTERARMAMIRALNRLKVASRG